MPPMQGSLPAGVGNDAALYRGRLCPNAPLAGTRPDVITGVNSAKRQFASLRPRPAIQMTRAESGNLAPRPKGAPVTIFTIEHEVIKEHRCCAARFHRYEGGRNLEMNWELFNRNPVSKLCLVRGTPGTLRPAHRHLRQYRPAVRMTRPSTATFASTANSDIPTSRAYNSKAERRFSKGMGVFSSSTWLSNSMSTGRDSFAGRRFHSETAIDQPDRFFARRLSVERRRSVSAFYRYSTRTGDIPKHHIRFQLPV